MKIGRKVFVLLVFFNGLKASAQTSSNTYKVDLPQLLPASPEPSAFVKSGLGNVNLSTGAATANIPLYTIKIKDFTFPISLSYSSQGLKADEVSSRVGLGWVLNATGMITRSVKGKPDDMALPLTPPADFNSESAELYNYLKLASDDNSGYDSQADEFQFNFNGYSGKFVLDPFNNYAPRVTATANLKINVGIVVSQSSSAGGIGLIDITTPDGVKYKFGAHDEITTTHNVQQFSVYKSSTQTAFFLDRIELPTGEYIAFNYSPIHIKVATGITQTLKVGNQTFFNGTECPSCSTVNGYTNQTNRVEYNTNYLTSITTSDGRMITLTYAPRPDLSNDNRLTGLEVQGIKKYLFDYYDVPGTSTTSSIAAENGRFFLTKVRDIKLNDVVDLNDSHDYVLSYNSLSSVPLPIKGGQDYLGYYNGGSNGASNGSLIPTGLSSDGTLDLSKRTPNPTYAQMGMLASIQYPTSGKEEYVYEPNTVPKTVKKDTRTTEIMEGRGDPSGMFKDYHSDIINITKNQTATFTLWATDADLNDGNSQTENHWTVSMEFYDGTTKISQLTSFDYNSATIDINLLAGHSYWWKMTVRNYTEIGHSSLYYDPLDHDVYETYNDVVPGMRVKQIKFTDPVTTSTHSKYYTYASLGNLSLSSGSCASPAFKSGGKTRLYCDMSYSSYTECQVDNYSSSSTQDVYNYSGSGSVMYYSTVIESDAPLTTDNLTFENGGTEYTFYENDNGGSNMPLIGGSVPNLPTGQYPTLTGVVHKKRTFDKNNQIVQEEISDYETIIDISNGVASYYVRMRYDVSSSSAGWRDAFDAIKMQYGSYWIRLKTKTTNTYTGGTTLTQKTDYTYGQPVNILPAAITTTDSKGQEVKTENKYPTDFPVENDYDDMIVRNIITPVVEESSYRNGILQQQKKILYKDWFGDRSVIMPEVVKVKESPADALHDALLYSKYDNAGNPLQLKKADDISLVYLWDAVHSLPLCEVRNASYDQVAFSGFEDGENYGNWVLTSGGTNTPGFTGFKSCFGTLSKTITVPGTYVVTLWTNASATVNSTSGAQIRTAQGWTLYQWVLTNPASVSVSGTNMDDIRLYPQGAQMATYTFRPFIGVTSKSDANNNVQYYEYDYMGRLSLVRDQDYNILKKYCYNYAGEPEDCGMDPTPLWQSTGQTRCKPCPQNSAYTTNIQQHEEKDNNPYSTTYNTTRWVEDGVNGNCVTASWQQTNLYCELNASGQYTGNQIKVEQDVNPCSPTYNQTRTTTMLNCATCPKPANWQPTGSYRCVKDASNNNTGAQEREEQDMESCSSTYGQFRWVSNGTNCSTCPKVASWQATGNYRCVKDASGNNTGYQEREEKDMESCSATYNTLRWVSNGYNPTACPPPCTSSNCSGNDRKCINGVCEVGTWAVQSSVWQKVLINGYYEWKWVCTWRYCFSDGTYSTYYEKTYQDTSCTVTCGMVNEM